MVVGGDGGREADSLLSQKWDAGLDPKIPESGPDPKADAYRTEPPRNARARARLCVCVI